MLQALNKYETIKNRDWYLFKFGDTDDPTIAEKIKIKNTINMDISLQTLYTDDLEVAVKLFSQDEKYMGQYVKWVEIIKRIPKYRNSKLRRNMKLESIKETFLESWLVELAYMKRNSIQRLTTLVKTIDWDLKKKDYQKWRYLTFKGKYRFKPKARDFYIKHRREPYSYKIVKN